MLLPCRYCLNSDGQTLVSCGAPAPAPSVTVATAAVTGSWTDQLTAWAGQSASPATLQLTGSNVSLCSTGLGVGNPELSAVSGLCDDGFVCAPLASMQMPDIVQANLNGEPLHIRRLVLLTITSAVLEVQAKEARFGACILTQLAMPDAIHPVAGVSCRTASSTAALCMLPRSMQMAHMQCDTGPTVAGSVAGVCASTLKGAVLVSNATNGLPVPVAYFPLAQDDASSWPLPQWTAEVTNISWTLDPVFGLTATCTVRSCRQQSVFRTAKYHAHPSFSACDSSSTGASRPSAGRVPGYQRCGTMSTSMQCCQHPQGVTT